MTLQELAKDKEFTDRFPYVWQRLELWLLQRQREFAVAHRSEYELSGRYVEFMGQLMDDLNQIASTVYLDANKPKRPKLNNAVFKD